MGKNHAEEVAKLLGVEIDEVFKIEVTNSNDYKFNENLELLFFSTTCKDWVKPSYDTTFVKLVRGEISIIKKPCKPKPYECYWFVDQCGNIEFTYFYNGSSSDVTKYKIGNCYRTKDEITPEIIQKWKDFYESDEVIDVFGKEED